ncbi:MAG: beta/gamma crystallin-related protein [Desulfobacterales bacterium]
MYEGHNFSGPVYFVYAWEEISRIGRWWNDLCSSVVVPPNCHLVVYMHHNFTGNNTTFSPGQYPNIGPPFENNISSAKCLCQ